MKKINSLLALAGVFAFMAAICGANTIIEDFSTDPQDDGWQVFGNTNLFRWNSNNRGLEVTWDSSQANSYFYHPLQRTLSRNDSFCVQFDLQMNDAAATGYGNEVAVGLLNLSDATNADFSRANGPLPNLFEFDYFPVDGYGDPASIDATLKDSQPGYVGLYWAYENLPLNPGATYRMVIIHRPGEAIVTGVIYANGQIYASLPNSLVSGTVGDFQLDTLSVSSFADDGFGDTLLAHGTVGKLAIASPLPVDRINTLAAGVVEFASDTHWLYTLEQSADLQAWTPAAPAVSGNGTNLVLQATNPPPDRMNYRVRADLP